MAAPPEARVLVELLPLMAVCRLASLSRISSIMLSCSHTREEEGEGRGGRVIAQKSQSNHRPTHGGAVHSSINMPFPPPLGGDNTSI